jgi:hypothetical protein
MSRGVPLTLVVSALLALAPATCAATRYAGPNGSMTVACTEHDQPCDIVHAFSQAQANDEVIIETGDYGAPGAPLGTPIVSTTAGLDVHGEDGKPRPRIFGATTGNNTSVLDLSGAGVRLRHVEIHQLGTDPGPIALIFDGAQASDIIAIAAETGNYSNKGCTLLGNSVLTNSVCEANGQSGVAVFPYRTTDAPHANTSTIRNVTAIASGSQGTGIEAIGGSTTSDNQTLTVRNTIVAVPSGQTALYAYKQTGDAIITIDHSNFGYQGTGFTQGQIVKGAGNQQLVGAPKFVAPGDYHIAAGSITIDKGADDPANGSTDIDGDARTLGQATDMGADEFVPPPVVTTGAAGSVTQTGAMVNGTVNPERLGTSYHFEYGTSTAYGTSTPLGDAGAGTADVPVNATLTGLAAGTTYHYRLVATNAGGTTPGADMTFATQSAPGGGGGTGAGPHFIGPLKVAAKVTFTLDRAATVRFTVERPTAGRRSRKRCVNATKKNRKAKKCTRYVPLNGRLDRASTSGKNSFKFARRWNGKKLAVGRYRLVAAALNAAGKTSDTRRASFKIVRH